MSSYHILLCPLSSYESLLFPNSAADIDLVVSNGLLPTLSKFADSQSLPAGCVSQVIPSSLPTEERIPTFTQAVAHRLIQIVAVCARYVDDALMNHIAC